MYLLLCMLLLLLRTVLYLLFSLLLLCNILLPGVPQIFNKSNSFPLSFPQCTTFDLIEKGIEVHIVADAVSSRRYLLSVPAINISVYSSVCVTTAFTVFLSAARQTDYLLCRA